MIPVMTIAPGAPGPLTQDGIEGGPASTHGRGAKVTPLSWTSKTAL